MSRNTPIIHFTGDELADRRRRTIEALTAQGIEGLLCFRQESMYYLSGYDTFGYVFFQCLYLGADGTMTLLTRAPDVRVAAYADTLTRRGITGFANACGYCLGTTFSPNWMDWPMFYRDNPVVVEPGMVFFMHMTTRDHDRGIGAAPGETVVVTETGCRRLSREVLEAGPF